MQKQLKRLIVLVFASILALSLGASVLAEDGEHEIKMVSTMKLRR